MSHGIKTHHLPYPISVKVSLLVAGSCTQFERLIFREGSLQLVQIPAIFAHIEHPTRGSILFDTGYSEAFFRASHRLPYSLYRLATPVHCTQEQSAAYQLKKKGINPQDVRYLILSHFHADHIVGVGDFPQAQFIYLEEAYQQVKNRSSWGRVRAGFLPDLLPPDFEDRSLLIDETDTIPLPQTYPFTRGLDLFGDGSLIGVELPGHAPGQMGILCMTEDQPYFLCADSVWSMEALEKNSLPHWLTYFIVDSWRQLKDTFQRVRLFHQRHPEYQIIPSHCQKVGRGIEEGKGLYD